MGGFFSFVMGWVVRAGYIGFLVSFVYWID